MQAPPKSYSLTKNFSFEPLWRWLVTQTIDSSGLAGTANKTLFAYNQADKLQHKYTQVPLFRIEYEAFVLFFPPDIFMQDPGKKPCLWPKEKRR